MLEGQNVILRLFAEADLDEYLSLANQYSQRGEYFPIVPRNPSETRKKFAETGWWDEHEGRLLITDKEGRMLGDIGFFKSSPYQTGYELGYSIYRREDRGKGYMSEALRLFSAYLFELKPIPRLYLHTSADNEASRKVAEKCGYKYEGTMRQAAFLRGTYHDCPWFSLLREDCPTLPELLRKRGRS